MAAPGAPELIPSRRGSLCVATEPDTMDCEQPAQDSPHNVIPALLPHWQLERRIGSGSQGEVWRARSRHNHNRVSAVKLLRACKDAQTEVAAYERLRKFAAHPNVLAVRFALVDDKRINLGFDLCRTDMLEHVLSKQRLVEADAAPWVRQLVRAVAHLHACDVVHPDIKLENLFIDQDDQLKLGDLGLSAFARHGSMMRKTCGSGAYMLHPRC